MTRLSTNERAEIRMAIAAGNEPRMTGTDRFQLPLGGRKRKLLVRPDGLATPAGEYWSQQTGAALPEGVDYAQEPTRIGPSDFIQVRGKRRRLRTWDPSANQFKYTTFGIKWAAERRVEVVVSIPVLIQGRNPNSGATWSRRGLLPVEQIAGRPVGRLFARAAGTQQEQINEVKRTVLDGIANQDNVLYEASGESWVYDEEGEWFASTMTTEMGARRPVTTAVLRGSLSSALDTVGGYQPAVLDLPHLFEICDEAFREANDFLCLPRQLSKMEGLDLDWILDELDICQELCYADLERSPFEVGQSWRNVGATPRMLLELARRWQYQCLVLHGARAFDIFSPPSEPKGLWVATWWGGHVYCWEGERAKKALWRRGLPASPPSTAPTRLARIVQRRGETAAAWKQWSCVAGVEPLPEGHFWAPDLHEVRRELLDRGYSPKLRMMDHHRISTLTLGKTKIHAVPEALLQVNAFLQRLPVHVPYRGENVPRLTFMTLLALLKPRRRFCSPAEKARILTAQEGRCAICGDPLAIEEAEFDHVLRRELDQTGEQRQQATHPHCHAQKTEQESGLFDQCPLASHLNPDVHKQYHQSAAIPPLSWKAKELERTNANLIVDVKRCRKRALQFASHDLPVLSPFDSIEEVADQKLGDIVFINAPYRDFVKGLGYTGPGWYHRVMAEHMLHFGICGWSAITHRIVATARVPKEALRAPLAEIEQAWDDQDMAKFSINSMIGTFGIRQSFLYEVTTSASELDAPTQPSYQVFTRHARGGVFDWITPIELRGPRSYRPIWDLILSAEAALVGKLIYLFRQVAPRGLGEFKTDSLLVTVPKRCQGKIQKMVQELKYSQLHVMRQRFEGASGSRRLDEHFPLTPVLEDVSVFRAAEAHPDDFMKTNPSLPERCEPPPVAAATLWADLSEEAAREHVLNGGSLQVQGAAGTGKSHWIAQVLAELEASGRRVQRCAKTHSVASKIKGATLDAFLRRAIVKGAALPQTLWVDEFSLIDSTSWCLLNFLLFSPEPVQIILSGDWAQLPGIGSCYKGAALPNGRVEQSQLLHQLCGGARLTLTICRRSDETLFDFYTSLSTGGARADEALGDVIAEARQLFPKRGEADYHLVISHARRKAINKALNEKRKPATGAVLYRAIPTPGLTSESQNMWLWPGLEVIACTRGVAHGLRHNVRYRIEAVSATTVRLQGVQSELSAEQAARHLRLPWASTYASAQGLEFDGRLELCDLSSKHLSRAHLLVGLSRARAHTLVQLGT